ncbi:MAG: hypothetical protein QW837_09505, partial [Conexivisphaerales archaeon]
LPFIRTDTIAGKSILAAIRDSVYTMRRGKPSLANRIGFFSFTRVKLIYNIVEGTTIKHIY